MDYAVKIAGLLKKAETTTPEEAELLVAKAQELMAMYAIDEAMLEHARSKKTDPIVEETIDYHSTYSRAMFDIGAAIARANDCKVLIRKGKDLMHTTLYIIGFKSDVEAVKLLNASLQIQAVASMNEWWKNRDYIPSNAREKFKLRREFLFSFAAGLQRKLRIAREAGRTQATQNEVHRAGVSGEQAADNVQMVLQTKDVRLHRYMEENYGGGRIRKGRRSNFARGDGDSSHAGYQAGQNANTTKPTPRKGLPA